MKYNWTYKEVMLEVRKMASYLISLNLRENSKIAILSKNCFIGLCLILGYNDEWTCFCSIVSKSQFKNVNKILIHSESEILFVGKLDNFDNI